LKIVYVDISQGAKISGVYLAGESPAVEEETSLTT
jgi:hypothetical protein